MRRGHPPLRYCLVCSHPERPTIDAGLAQKRSIRGMSKRFGMGIHSLYRHKKAHMPPALIAQLLTGSPYEVENLEALQVRESERLLANAVEVRRRLYLNAEGAEKVGDYKGAVNAYDKILHSLELIGRLLDSFHGRETKTINQLIVSPDYLRLRAALIQALQPYPEARQAVAKVLRELEAVDAVEATAAAKVAAAGAAKEAGNGGQNGA